ncbi:MAG: putative toxin-antitoxin system toxin component, PIN family [Fibromonadales bacterium]|nr:putative toxin-antitoxin system toxin component, PIN family [Fibromonadales bacterium]
MQKRESGTQGFEINMQKVVFDTNVLVSYLINGNGVPAKAVSLFFDGKIDVFYSNIIYEEYEEVLNREHFHFDKTKILKILKDLTIYGKLINPVASLFLMSDEDDRIFYDTAKQSGSFLITGNKRHYPQENFILTPAEFLET